jgi:G3E family GTPase
VLHCARRYHRYLDRPVCRPRKGKVPFFTRVAIETTGLADPAPILHT